MKIKYIGQSKNSCFFCHNKLSVKYMIDIENDPSTALHVCNRCYAERYYENNTIEVDLEKGLLLCVLYYGTKLYSDGLQSDEYIYYDIGLGCLCYEDRAVIGENVNEARDLLLSLGWTKGKRFYLRCERN